MKALTIVIHCIFGLTLRCVLTHQLTSGSLLQLRDFSGFDGRGTFFLFATPTGAPGGGGGGGGGAKGPVATGGPPGGGGGAGGGGGIRGGGAGGTPTPGVRGGPPGT